MSYRYRRICTLALLALLLYVPVWLPAQTFTGKPVQRQAPGLQQELTAWEVYQVDAAALETFLKNNPDHQPAAITLGSRQWKLELAPSRVLAENYTLQVQTPHGVEVLQPTEQRAYQGRDLTGGGLARLTVDDNFISGFVQEGGQRTLIQPLRFFVPGAPADEFVVYSQQAVIARPDAACGIDELDPNSHPADDAPHAGDESQAESQACYQLELAIASDRSMFDKYGSVSDVENHNIAVINDVQVNYNGWFIHDIEILIVTQFVVTGTDPWTSSLNAGTLLGSFQQWGQAGNFGVTFDLGELWTNRDFTGGTVGIAWVGAVCTAQKYHCLQDFTNNSEHLRCMTAHEIGHNFDCDHDGSGSPFIMAPAVSSADDWSTASINSVNAYLPGRINSGCLASCGPPPPPLIADFTWAPDPGCPNQPVSFSDESSGNITGRAWTFPSGTPGTSTQTNPTVTWTTPGTYNVKLTITGAGGSNTITKAVTIQPLPVANFSYSVDGTTITFNNNSTNSTGYTWNFGDGNFSNDADPVHTYLEGGIYTVVLTVTNDCGSNTKTVVVNTAPTADFTADPTQGCASLTVQFDNESSSNAVSYVWSFPGGIPSSSNQTNPVVIYPTSGQYTVTLVATNPAGTSTMVRTNYITVQNIPSASFTFTTNGLLVNFTNTSANATSSSWNFGDGGTSNQTSPSHTYATGGTYTVTLTSTNGCGSVTTTQTVTLGVPPTASFTASPTSGCGPLTVQFTNNSSGNPTSYAWVFAGGTPATSTATNPTVVYNAPGTYSVTLTATNGVGSNTSTQTNLITVNPPPTAGFSSTVNGLTATFTNTSVNGATYNWTFGDGGTSTSTNPTHAYAADGVYTVTLTTTNPCGTATATGTVTIVTPPPATFTATPTSGCGPLQVQFAATATNATSFTWTFPGGTPGSSSLQNPVVTYNTPGSYSVTLVASNSAGSNTNTQTNLITVNPPPTANFSSSTSGATATFTNTSVNATSYGWNFGDGGTSTQTNPTHTYATDGTYTVTLTATGACGVHTSTQTVVIVTPPTAGFSANVTSGCAPLTVQFTNQSSPNATTFAWSFPGGTPVTSTLQHPVVVYNTPGTYSVTLTASNGAGSNTATQTNYITVGTTPTPGFTYGNSGLTVSFTNTSTGATSYNWNFGDGNTGTAPNPTHTYPADGIYTVILTATNACGSTTSTQTITLVTPPTAGFTASPTNGCAPMTVQFTNTSSPNATAFAWQFPGGSPATSTAQNPSVVYNSPGTYSVTLTASNSAGSNTATQTNLITVGAAPTAGFSATTSGATATFTNSSTNATSYAWNFGDGGTSNLPNPTHTYAGDGTYTVTLTAMNACGQSTATQTVVIITSPSAGFTANITTGCAGMTVQFQDLSSGNTTGWSWTFEGGTPGTSTQQNPQVTYNTPGTYDVTLVASTTAGTSTFTQSNFITVLGPPAAGFTPAVNGSTVTFDNTSTNATAYFWDFGDGNTAPVADPTHTYAADGIYTVSLTAINSCDSVTVTQQVTVVTAPSAGFSLSAESGCAPLAVQFTNQSSPNATVFAWTFEGGSPATSTEASPSASWAQPGTYLVTLIASNGAGSDTTSATVTVTGLPTAGFTVQNGGLSVVLTNTSANATSYFWDFGDGGTSTEPNPVHAYASVGDYTIKLVATNDCGTSEQVVSVEISGSAPLAAFSANATSGCAPLTVTFTDQSVGNPTAWSWTFEGGQPASSQEQNPTVTFSAPGDYTVSLQATNAFGSDTAVVEAYISVLTFPTAAFTFAVDQSTVTFTNNSAGATQYQWTFGDGGTSTEANPTHTYSQPGTYMVQLNAINACGAATLQQSVAVTITGVGEAAWTEQFRLFPNPTPDAFTVEMSGAPAGEVEFLLFNALGSYLRRETVGFGSGKLVQRFDFSDLPPALYTLGVKSGEKIFYVKIAVQR